MAEHVPTPLANHAGLQARLLLLTAVVVVPLLAVGVLAFGPLAAWFAEHAPARPAIAWLCLLGAVVAGGAVAASLVLARRQSRAFDAWAANQRREADAAMQRLRADFERQLQARVDAVAEDTQRKQAAEAAAQQTALRTELGRARRQEALSQLTGGIAQDFNNLLTVIVGHLDQLAATAGPDGERGQLAQAALKAALRGSELTSGLLAFARQQPLSPRPVDLGARLPALLPVLERTVGAGVRIASEFAPNLWIAEVDPAQLEAALVNLVLNAREAMPQGGTLGIVAGNVHLDEDYVARNPKVEPGDYIMLAVTDTGVGMPPEVVEAAFDPLFTTKAYGEYTGLGLSMVYGFAAQSRGHVKIYSEVGHGTTVRLYLPRSAVESDEREPGEAPPAEAMPTGTETILLVEDDADVRALSTRHLTALGYRVRAAENGPDAVAVLETAEPFDLLFTDIVMPGGMTGYGVADVAVAQRPGIKVLFTTGYAGPSAAHGHLRHAGARMLRKPFRKQELAEAVRGTLDRH